MLTSLRYRLKGLFSHIWAPISAYAMLGLLAAMMAMALRDLIPSSWALRIGADAIDDLLNIIASSMLVVTTFSVSIMVSAFSAASNTATPRAFQLLKTDRTAQQVLASFIGAFIFSLVGIISLKIGIYGEGGRVILFAATILVLVLIIFNLVRWIGHLTTFGRMDDTMKRVEDAAANAMASRLETPWMGANPMHRDAPPEGTVPLRSDAVGHVQYINLGSLNTCAAESGCNIYIDVLPGEFIYDGSVLAHVLNGPVGEDYDALLGQIRDCFEIGMNRSFDQDPRFGMITLSEIASRALSPAVNDPGTAIDVVRRMTRVLSLWQDRSVADVEFPHLWIRGLQSDEMLRDAFAALSRDGAALYEVQISVQNALLALVRLNPSIFAKGVVAQSSRAMSFAREAMLIADDIARLEAIAQDIRATAALPAPNSLLTRT